MLSIIVVFATITLANIYGTIEDL